ncbi:MAG: hypothetical protein JWO89_3188, partial [Verrucomicrobiaceae bacterium]|nr:hypothetical protein [Verrucomicrobiaceae bacterium]
LKMITLAHTMSAQTVPPLAFFEVVSERSATPGVDFFEGPRITDEKLGTSPVSVARIFRSSADEYSITLSASRSVDTQKRPLKYRWELLQGGREMVSIEPKDEGRTVTLRVPWHSPMISAAGIRSHRVDIGLFVSNGVTVSSPAIVSFYMLPNERRFFDAKGRLSEVCYEAANPEMGLPSDAEDLRWLAFIEVAGVVDDSLVFHSLSDAMSRKQRAAFSQAWMELAPTKRELDRLAADPASKGKADQQRATLGKALATTLAIKASDEKQQSITLREAVEAIVGRVTDLADLFTADQQTLFSLAVKSPKASALADLRAECKRLADWGVLVEKDGVYKTAHSPARFTEADRYYLRQLHLTVLSQVLLPGLLERSPAPLFADPRLTTRKSWRDVYHYDAQGTRTGWDRFYQGKVLRFDAEGRLTSDDGKAAKVSYRENAGHLIFDLQGSKN